MFCRSCLEELCYFLVLLHSTQMRLACLPWLDQLHKIFPAGVSQISFLKALFFNLYLLLFNNLICQCGPKFHVFAHDKQIDVIKLAPNIPSTISVLPACQVDDKVWMFRNFIQFNASKIYIDSEEIDTISNYHSFVNLPLWAHYKEFCNSKNWDSRSSSTKIVCVFSYIKKWWKV